MPGIPDHPVIHNMEASGHPYHIKEHMVHCEDCGEELVAEDRVFDYDGDALCENCFRERIMENISSEDLAVALGLTVQDAYDYASEMEEE